MKNPPDKPLVCLALNQDLTLQAQRLKFSITGFVLAGAAEAGQTVKGWLSIEFDRLLPLKTEGESNSLACLLTSPPAAAPGLARFELSGGAVFDFQTGRRNFAEALIRRDSSGLFEHVNEYRVSVACLGGGGAVSWVSLDIIDTMGLDSAIFANEPSDLSLNQRVNWQASGANPQGRIFTSFDKHQIAFALTSVSVAGF